MPAYCPILATLGYVMSEDGMSVLLVHRNKRPDDVHYGKYNGLGGKIEKGEDIVTGLRREIEAKDVVLRGTISWPGFGKGGEDWFGFIFRVDSWAGTVKSDNHEGSLEWVEMDRLDEINFWESDRHWLDMVFSRDVRTFHGHAPFENGRMISWSCELI
jgi:8-oxo-dGTP diphosphatase